MWATILTLGSTAAGWAFGNLKWVVVALLALILMWSGCSMGYARGKAVGARANYKAGYNAGYADGKDGSRKRIFPNIFRGEETEENVPNPFGDE